MPGLLRALELVQRSKVAFGQLLQRKGCFLDQKNKEN